MLVVMRSAAGEPPGDAPITAETLGRHAPRAEDTERVRRFFAERDLEPGPLVGIAFTVCGDRDRIESLFPDFEELEGSGRELPLAELPQQIRALVATVTTEEPPELFG